MQEVVLDAGKYQFKWTCVVHTVHKIATPAPAEHTAVEPIGGKEAAPTCSAQISINQEAISRRQSGN